MLIVQVRAVTEKTVDIVCCIALIDNLNGLHFSSEKILRYLHGYNAISTSY